MVKYALYFINSSQKGRSGYPYPENHVRYRYVWIFENSVKELSSHLKRALFSPKVTI